MNIKSVILLALFLLTCNFLLYSIEISGTVLDEHNCPFPYANISLKSSPVGTFTNKDGKFILSIPEKNDTIIVSSVGYANNKQKLLYNKRVYEFKMTPMIVGMNEVVVSNITAESLLKKAITKIPDNYPQQPILLKAFYRLKIYKKDTLAYAEESGFNIIKSYKEHTDDITFVDKNRNFYVGNGFSHSYLRGISSYDIVKEEENYFPSSFFKKHIIRFSPATMYDNHQVYVLHIIAKKDSTEGFDGNIYIDVNDLAFIRFDFTYPKSGKHIVAQYKKKDNQYYFSFGYKENGQLRNGMGVTIPKYSTNSQWIITNIDRQFSKDTVPGNLYQTGSALIGYPNNESDTIFWKGYNRILPDSSLEKQIMTYRADIHGHIVNNQKILNTVLLYPEYSFWISAQTPNNLSTFTKNMTSIDELLEYRINKFFKKNILAKFFFSYTYNWLLSSPFMSVEAERELLASTGMRINYSPTICNTYKQSYSYGLGNIAMNNMKNCDFSTYMRLHTIRNDAHYTASKLIEEKLARVELSNINNKLNYITLYGLELFTHRESTVFWGLGSEPQTSNVSENKQPLIIDLQKSWVKYLFEPDFGYKRQVTENDLNNNEIRYLRRSSLFSLLNFVSPQMLGIGKIRLSESDRFTFSLNYLRTVFGEMFEQNIWLMHNSTLSGIFLRQYVNHEKAGVGLGYKLYETPLAKNFYLTSNLNYWCQPSGFSFYNRSFSNGFSINQQLDWQFARDKYIKRNNMSLFLGYHYKSRGYEPDNLYLKANFDVQVGIRFLLK